MKSIYTAVLFVLFVGQIQAQDSTVYVQHKPCMFTVNLPDDISIEEMWDSNEDHCDYKMIREDKMFVIELHSLLKSRFKLNSIEEMYNNALQAQDDVTYMRQIDNWFVLSWMDKKSENVRYWKRSCGENFVSDLFINYSLSKKDLIEPHIAEISSSFKSE